MKTGRNEKCFCGSGKKYKKCCINKKQANSKDSKSIDGLIHDAGMMALEHDKKSIDKSILILKKVLLDSNLSEDSLKNAKLNLSVAYRHLGEHKKAIDTLEELEEFYDGESDFSQYILNSLAISYEALGFYDESCRIYESLLESWENVNCKSSEDRKKRGIYLIEAGKSFHSNKNIEKAIECWTSSIEYLQEFSESEAEHIGRARANIAFAKLGSDKESIQKEGINELEESSRRKLKIGDAQGLANNYCNLGTYFRKKKRYARAISYYRKDLFLSEMVGNKRDIASTLGNFATMYAELKQFKQGREMLRKAKLLAEELSDDMLHHICEQQLNYINSEAKLCGLNKVGIGDKAECACGSDKLYVECCGLADFEPVSMPQIYGGISEEAKRIHDEISSTGRATSPLDFILRTIPRHQQRKSWTEHGVHDGWISMKELPDMASLHIISAKEMANKASGNDELNSSLSAVILAVCHLEAFINQVSYFLLDNIDHPEVEILDIPDDLKDKGAYNYQRTTSLEEKWKALSNCLNGSGWLESLAEWKDVKDLIYIRNELVHFKTNGYEQVVPPPRTKGIIYSKVPTSVVTRDEPHSWPFKILTGSLANWAVEISERLVNKMKDDYNSSRRSGTV
ncbi:tetratricopeptide repeat protein [Desulfobotulus mexicanus]|nr:tetratricopeptide repeat protein [Desulfobotulus mexicanus]